MPFALVAGRVGIRFLALIAVAAALEALAFFAITFERTVYHLTGTEGCGLGCLRLTFESVQTHPYFVLGILMAAAGTILVGLAVFLARRKKPGLAIHSAT